MADSIDTQLENALSRAQGASTAAATEFSDVVNRLVFPLIQNGVGIQQPPYLHPILVSPAPTLPLGAQAQVAAVQAATQAFIDTYFPVEPELLAASARAKQIVLAGLTSEPTLPGGAVDDLMGNLRLPQTPPERVNGDGVSAVDAYIAATAHHAETAIRGKTSAALRAFLTTIAYQANEREAFIQATTGYVTALVGLEYTSSENAVRTNEALSAMAQASAKWFATQSAYTVTERTSLEKEHEATSRGSMNNTALYSDVETRVKAAVAGASELASLAAAARNTIAAITSAAKMGFE